MSEDDFILTRTPLGDYLVCRGGGRKAPWEVRGMGLRLQFAQKQEALDSLEMLSRRLPEGDWSLYPDVRFTVVS